MDEYGVVAALKSCYRMVNRTMRRTGRTTRLVDSLKDGDVVVFTHHEYANEFLRVARDRGVKANFSTTVVDLHKSLILQVEEYMRGRWRGKRIRLDHLLVEELVDLRLKDIETELGFFQQTEGILAPDMYEKFVMY